MTTDDLLDALAGYGIPARLMREIQRRFDQLDQDNIRRAKNAERMRSVRARERTCEIVQHSAAQICTDQQATENNDKNFSVRAHAPDPTYTYKEVSKKERKQVSAGKVALPAEFEMNAADLAACREAGWSTQKTNSELQHFRDHASQNGRRCADWHAAWRNWVRSPYQTQLNGKSHPTEKSSYKPSVLDFDERPKPP